MTLSHGRDLFLTPGPSVIPDRVLNAMHKAAPNIYEGPLIAQTEGIMARLKTVAQTGGTPAIYIANGHGAWEASLTNVLEPGQKMLALATGRFGHGYAETAQRMGIDVQILDFGTTTGFDPQKVEEALRADVNHEIRVVTSVQTDTSTSVSNDIPALRAALDAAGHPALLMVDCIASLGCERFEMDKWGVDVMVAGCQKGLMTPPGLAFTFHNDKAQAVSEKVNKTSPYWDWEPRVHPQMYYQQFGGTPPTHLLFGLDEALKMIVDEEGIENVWQRHRVQAEAVWAAIDVWGEAGALQCNVPARAERSTAVTTVVSETHDLTKLRVWCEESAGLVLGIGLGAIWPDPDRIMRIGHMGHMNPPMLLGALATIDAGLKALDIPHGSGALDTASAVIAAG